MALCIETWLFLVPKPQIAWFCSCGFLFQEFALRKIFRESLAGCGLQILDRSSHSSMAVENPSIFNLSDVHFNRFHRHASHLAFLLATSFLNLGQYCRIVFYCRSPFLCSTVCYSIQSTWVKKNRKGEE